MGNTAGRVRHDSAGGYPVTFLSAPLADLKPLQARAFAGDAEAREYFDTLFPPTEPCAICDHAIGPAGTATYIPDPTAPGMALLLPYCGACRALPPHERNERELTMARAMWPRVRWRASHANDPGYRRGGPPKRRCAP